MAAGRNPKDKPITPHHMIKIELIGCLGADAAQIAPKNGGEPFAALSIACTEKKGDKENTVWVEATTKQMGVLPYLTKSRKVYVEGYPEVSVYTKRDGTTAGKLVVRVKNLELL